MGERTGPSWPSRYRARMADGPNTDREHNKRVAGEAAVKWVESGTTVGLGTGSTAIWAIRKLGALITSGDLGDIVAVPTSRASAHAAAELGIPLTTLEEVSHIDLTIDGADEVDPDLNLVKGGGGALLHEKIVAQATRREVIVVDSAKPSACLGTKHELPVEIVPFAAAIETDFLASLGAKVVLRRSDDGQPFVTDEANHILDCDFGPIADLDKLDAQLHARAGIVEHGLFLGLTADLLIAGPDGVEHRTRP